MRALLVLILALAAVAGFLFFLLGPSGEDPAVSAPTRPVEAPVTPPQTAELQAPVVRVETEEVAPIRVDADETEEVRGGYTNKLSGKVVNIDGAPVSGAEVLLSTAALMGQDLANSFFNSNQEPAGEPESTKSDEQGEYAFYAVDPRSDYYLAARHPDFKMTQESRVVVGEQGDYLAPDLILVAGSTLKGYVTDSSGNPIANAQVHTDSAYVFTGELESPDRQSGTTNGAGFYEIRNVPEGARNVMAEAEGYGRELQHNIVFKGDDGEEKILEFQLEPGQSLEGRVVGPDGLGIEGAKILALNYGNTNSSRGKARTDETGYFQLLDLGPGSYMMRVTADGFRQAPGRGNRAQAGQKDVEIQMVVQCSVAGVAVDSSGNPIKGFKASLQYVDETGTIFEEAGVTGSFQNDDGSFELIGVDPGLYVVQVQAKGYAKGNSQPFRVTAEDQLKSGVSVRLGKGGSFAGVVLDASGSPVKGARVSTQDNSYVDNLFNDMFKDIIVPTVTLRRTRTDAKGQFELDLLSPGTYQVHVEHEDFTRFIVKDKQLGEGQQVDLGALSLTAGGTIRGTVLDAAGKVMPRSQVILRGDDGVTSYMEHTDANGRYEFTHVKPGAYKLSATRRSPSAGGDVFTAVVDQRNSEVAISVFDGAEVARDLNLGQ